MTRILGIDFSGAKDAGKKIWIATATQSKSPLEIATCQPATKLPGGGKSPEIALEALRRYILAEADTIAGCDFPFSLPITLVHARSWETFLLNFQKRYPSPQMFHDLCHRETEGVEIKRRTDSEDKTPFNSFNLRLFRQTWWGITHVLAPLVERHSAQVLPQMHQSDSLLRLVEVCAACTLNKINVYPSYKGKTAKHRDDRNLIITTFIERKWLAKPSPAIRDVILDNRGGDALDAVIGAVAVNRAIQQRRFDHAPNRFHRLEGRVFYEL